MKQSIITHLQEFDFQAYDQEFSRLLSAFEQSNTLKEQLNGFEKLNDHRFLFETSFNSVRLEHFRDLKDESRLSKFKEFNRFESRYQQLTEDYYRKLLISPFRQQLEERFGKQLFRLADLKQNTHSHHIEDDLQRENELVMKYQSLLGKAVISFSGEEHNLSTITTYLNSSDRTKRKMAHIAKYQFFKENERLFDQILDELVQTRHSIATRLGYPSFVDLGYKRMHRTGHTPSDLKKYREQVQSTGVPFVSHLRKSQAERIGVESLKHYDEGVLFSKKQPTPKGSRREILEQFKRMFSELSPETYAFFEELRTHDLLDLDSRPGKMGGNFATYIGEQKYPYIFANFHGNANDVRVFTHEAGHAFQFYMSRHWNIPEYIIPYDSAEVFSFGMERLAWPWMESFFGDETKHYQYAHVITPFMYMPLASAVDEFEHYLYEKPSATIEDRKTKWRELEHTYLPERDYSGNEFLEKGTSFYEIGHLFTTPFYFMDYDLAHYCAVQLWMQHQSHPDKTWAHYLEMCKNGGKLSFPELISTADITSPFEKDSLTHLLQYVQDWIHETESRLEL